MTWNNETPIAPPPPSPAVALPLRIVRVARWLVAGALLGWTAFFAVHLASDVPAGCTRAEFMAIVWQMFAPGYAWLSGALAVCWLLDYALGRKRGDAA